MAQEVGWKTPHRGTGRRQGQGTLADATCFTRLPTQVLMPPYHLECSYFPKRCLAPAEMLVEDAGWL